MDAAVYNERGEKTGTVKLPGEIFSLPWNGDLVHQVVVGMRENARIPVAHTKTRKDVRGGGRKPWPQKGTGQARHGSRRSPLWRGGGTTFGPRAEKVYGEKINRKMRAKALGVVLARKFRDGEILFIDGFSFGKPSAKGAKEVLQALARVPGFETLSRKKRNAAVVALAERREAVRKSFRNFGNVSVAEARNLNPVELLAHRYLILERPAETLSFFAKRLGAKSSA